MHSSIRHHSQQTVLRFKIILKQQKKEFTMARIPPNAVNVLLELGIQMLKAIKELNENGKLLPPEKPKEEKGEKNDKSNNS